MRPGAPRPGFVVVNTAMLWLTLSIAATTLWPIYRSTALAVLVLVSLAVGSLIAILGAVFRWPAIALVGATVLAFLAVGVPLAVPGEAQYGILPTVDGLRDLVFGVALGWKQLLTISLPVGEYEALLVPALVLMLGGTVLALSVAIRMRRGEVAVLVPAGIFVVATAFGPTYPDRPLVTPIALLVCVLLWLVWFRWYRRRRAIALLDTQPGSAHVPDAGRLGLRTILGAGVILAIASGSAVAAAQALSPTADRSVLRTGVQQKFDPREYVSPLAGFRSYLKAPIADSVLFTVSGLKEGTRIRLATLDTYDGVVYSVGSDTVSSASGSFTRVPSSIDRSTVRGSAVSANVTVDDYTGVWVPTVGSFESIVFSGGAAQGLRDGFFYNDVTGTAAALPGIAAGDVYTLDAVLPDQPTRAQLADLEPGAAQVPAPTGVPDELTAKLDEYTTGIDGGGARLVAMLDGLAADGYISHGIGSDEPPSRSGHAADRIAELLSAPRMIGDAEQYAVAAALMADDLGFPSRVVVGFVPTAGEVTGNDISAWIEVNTSRFGWVAIDPTPAARDIPDEVPEDSAQVARPQTIVPPPVAENEPADPQSAPESEQELAEDLDPLLQAVIMALRVLAGIAIAVAVVMSPFLVVIAAKLRRRRLRRRAADVTTRISGGWQEFEDSVIDHGLSPGASATRSEVASIVGGIQSQVLAAVADRAVFAPDVPLPADADSVWRAVDELQQALGAGLTRWQRLRAAISLRSLGGYSVRRLFTKQRTGR